MQPTIICTAPTPGMLYINGRFAGELSPDVPLCAPVSPQGPVYLEYRPLTGDEPPITRKCVFSGGQPMPESLAEAEGLSCVEWPGGALEIEFFPLERSEEEFLLDGVACRMIRGRDTRLRIGGTEVALPEGARAPRLERRGEAALLTGEIEGGGQYLAALAPGLSGEAGTLIADRIDGIGNGGINALISLGDSVGHGRLEQWVLEGGMLRRVSSESVWMEGGPRWPQTPDAAMRAAVEAVLAGLPGEADGYLTPALAAAAPLADVAEICDVCVPMKFPLPDGHPCVGLLRAENGHLARVRPLYYRAVRTGGLQGPWQIEAVSTE